MGLKMLLAPELNNQPFDLKCRAPTVCAGLRTRDSSEETATCVLTSRR